MGAFDEFFLSSSKREERVYTEVEKQATREYWWLFSNQPFVYHWGRKTLNTCFIGPFSKEQLSQIKQPNSMKV